MARWSDMRKEIHKEVEDKWKSFVRLDVDSEGNAISIRTAPREMEQDEDKCELVRRWWNKTLEKYYKEPEYVHPLIVEMLAPRVPFTLLVNIRELPE